MKVSDRLREMRERQTAERERLQKKGAPKKTTDAPPKSEDTVGGNPKAHAEE